MPGRPLPLCRRLLRSHARLRLRPRGPPRPEAGQRRQRGGGGAPRRLGRGAAARHRRRFLRAPARLARRLAAGLRGVGPPQHAVGCDGAPRRRRRRWVADGARLAPAGRWKAKPPTRRCCSRLGTRRAARCTMSTIRAGTTTHGASPPPTSTPAPPSLAPRGRPTLAAARPAGRWGSRATRSWPTAAWRRRSRTARRARAGC